VSGATEREVLVDDDGGVCTLTINRPAKRNALTRAMLTTLEAAIRHIAAAENVRVLIVRGAGTAFCAGLDLQEMATQRAEGEAEMRPIEDVFAALDACPQPTIAAIQGDAVAGGCELGLHCDLRIAADTARFTMPVAKFGLAPPVNFTWKLVDAVGLARAKEMLFTGEPMAAEEALACNLVNRVVPASRLAETTEELARRIAANAPLAIRAIKAFVQRSLDFRHVIRRDDLDDLDRRIRQSADLEEGLAAKRERRPPVFQGK
jgi:enoyl-CoA hydratase/carnithine racemase